MAEKRQHEPNHVTLEWEQGTAYDFFISYRVLSDPKRFGVRSSWASGMRARLQPAERETLDTSLLVLDMVGQWLYGLPSPKDVAHCLRALEEIPAAQRVPRLACGCGDESERSAEHVLLHRVRDTGAWDDATLQELRQLRSAGKHAAHGQPNDHALIAVLNAWADAEAFGERYLRALRSYNDVFFAEEERRIGPKLEAALEHAKARAKQLPFGDLIEELSQGIRYEGTYELSKLTLVPSYWISPFIQTVRLGTGHRMWAFGARPAQDSIVPGDPVPDALRASLKALADPTRLRILRYLYAEPLTLSELTKRLRLRMPTVMHHLSALRLAGLVSIHMETGEKGLRQRYGTRTEGLAAAVQTLKQFIENDETTP